MTFLACVGPLAGPAHADDVRDSQWHLDYLNIPAAHRISQGEGVTVAVVDTGVDATHPDLRGATVPGADGFAKGQGFVDYHNHGTGLASLVAGRGHGAGNRAGILGVAPKSKIMPITVMGPRDRGTRPHTIARGIGHAVDHGADVVLVAFAGPPDPSLDDVVEYALSRNVLVVASAGQNEHGAGGAIGYPAEVEGVLAVSAVDRAGRRPSWANAGSKMALAAPGVDIPVATRGGGHTTVKGTSAAAAIVAGIAALIRAEFPRESAREIALRLAYTAVDKGPKGRDHQYGFGIPDATKAVSLTAPPRPTASPSAASATARRSFDAAVPYRSPRDWIRMVATIGVVVLFVAVIAVLVLRRLVTAPRQPSDTARRHRDVLK